MEIQLQTETLQNSLEDTVKRNFNISAQMSTNAHTRYLRTELSIDAQ